MITLKNKHKTKVVPRDLDKASRCTWEETALGFSGALTATAFASVYRLCCLLSGRDVAVGGENLGGEREEEVLVKNMGCSES